MRACGRVFSLVRVGTIATSLQPTSRDLVRSGEMRTIGGRFLLVFEGLCVRSKTARFSSTAKMADHGLDGL